MLKTTKIIFAIFFLWLCSLSYFIFKNSSATSLKKTVFIDNYKVFDEFGYKKKQDTLLFRIEEEVSIQLDSITEALNNVRNEISVNPKSGELLLKYNALKKEYSAARQEAENTIKSESTRLTNEVYKKLNGYIEEYGKIKSLDIILGSDGNGSVMYVDSAMNVTEDVINFINSKYSKS